MRNIVALVLVASLLLPRASRSEDTMPPVVYPLNRGQIAPYTGVLFSQSAAASVIADKQTLQDKIDLAVKNAVDVVEAQKNHDVRVLTAKCQSELVQINAKLQSTSSKLKLLQDDFSKLEKQAADAEETAATRPLWTGIGFAGGVIISIATAFAVSHISK